MVQSMHMSPEEETEVVPSKPKRAPRKRAPKAVSDDAGTPAPLKRTPRKRAPKNVAVEEPVLAPVKKTTRSTVRKAPTPIIDAVASKKKKRKQTMVIAVMILVGVGASAAVGFTDKGQIDVESTIAWRNEQARGAGRDSEVIPVQNTPQLPDGGLIGMGIGGPIDGATTTPPAAAPVATTTASSSEPAGQVPLTNAEAEAAAQTQPQ